MKYNFSLIFLLLVCFSIATINHVDKADGCRKSEYVVKVLLNEYDIHDRGNKQVAPKQGQQESNQEELNFILKSNNGFLLTDGTVSSKVFFCKSGDLVIKIKNNFMFVNDRKYLRKTLKVAPKDGDIKFGKYVYQGDFLFVLEGRKLYLINKIDLEDYVFAVLSSETWPKWPLEVNKVFAVAIRTYVTKRAQDAKRAKRLYHIKNTNTHQTYRGHVLPNCGREEYEKLRKAVLQTSDLVLIYKGDIIDPLYDCCCGGVTPGLIEGKINFKKAPYLKRMYPCKYCKNCSVYNWSTSYNFNELEKLLGIKNIKNISVSRFDKAGLVKEVKIKSGASRTIRLTGDKLYKELKKIKSFCYDFKKKGNSLVVSGRGYGHHMGICQWGAREMVRQNFDYKQILDFYYPGSVLAKFPRD